MLGNDPPRQGRVGQCGIRLRALAQRRQPFLGIIGQQHRPVFQIKDARVDPFAFRLMVQQQVQGGIGQDLVKPQCLGIAPRLHRRMGTVQFGHLNPPCLATAAPLWPRFQPKPRLSR